MPASAGGSASVSERGDLEILLYRVVRFVGGRDLRPQILDLRVFRFQLAGELGLPSPRAVQIDFQLLAYPVMDHDLTRPSYAENGQGNLLETRTMAWFWDQYCPDQARRAEPAASPLRAASFTDLPAALIATASGLLLSPTNPVGSAIAHASQPLPAAGGAA